MTATEAPAPVSRRRSYTQLSTYRDCPHCYYHKYVLREPEQPAVWSIGGTAFHQVAEWYLNGDLGEDPGIDRTFDAWAAAWQIAYDETVRRNPLAAETPIEKWRAADRGKEDAVWWDREGLRMVRRFIEWRQATAHQLTVIGLEQRIETELGGVPMVAIPDWIAVDENGQACIVDYKTGKPPKDSLQLGVYRQAIAQELDLHADWGLYWMARPARILPMHLGKWTNDLISELFVRFDADVRLEIFDPNPDCRYCPCRRKKKR